MDPKKLNKYYELVCLDRYMYIALWSHLTLPPFGILLPLHELTIASATKLPMLDSSPLDSRRRVSADPMTVLDNSSSLTRQGAISATMAGSWGYLEFRRTGDPLHETRSPESEKVSFTWPKYCEKMI